MLIQMTYLSVLLWMKTFHSVLLYNVLGENIQREKNMILLPSGIFCTCCCWISSKFGGTTKFDILSIRCMKSLNSMTCVIILVRVSKVHVSGGRCKSRDEIHTFSFVSLLRYGGHSSRWISQHPYVVFCVRLKVCDSVRMSFCFCFICHSGWFWFFPPFYLISHGPSFSVKRGLPCDFDFLCS